MEMLTKSQGFADDTPAVVKEWWRAIKQLPSGPRFKNDQKERDANRRYDRANLARIKAGYGQADLDRFLVFPIVTIQVI